MKHKMVFVDDEPNVVRVLKRLFTFVEINHCDICGEKGFENAVEHIRRYTATGVRNLDDDGVTRLAGGNVNFTLVFDGLGRINQKVHEHLVQLTKVADGLRKVPVGLGHFGLVF